MSRNDPRWTNQDVAIWYLYHQFIGAALDDSLPEISNPRDGTKELGPQRTQQVNDILRSGYAAMARECEDYLVNRGLMSRQRVTPIGMQAPRSIPTGRTAPPIIPSDVTDAIIGATR